MGETHWKEQEKYTAALSLSSGMSLLVCASEWLYKWPVPSLRSYWSGIQFLSLGLKGVCGACRRAVCQNFRVSASWSSSFVWRVMVASAPSYVSSKLCCRKLCSVSLVCVSLSVFSFSCPIVALRSMPVVPVALWHSFVYFSYVYFCFPSPLPPHSSACDCLFCNQISHSPFSPSFSCHLSRCPPSLFQTSLNFFSHVIGCVSVFVFPPFQYSSAY